MTINKAMILAAGFGKRMLPLTEKIPKPLIMVGPKSLLERSIELLIKIGINELVINTHYLPQKIDHKVFKPFRVHYWLYDYIFLINFYS